METNTRNVWIGIIVLIIIVIGVWYFVSRTAPSNSGTATTTSDVIAPDEAQVRAVVTDFGGKLQQVSLLAPDAGQEIASAYASDVAPQLLQAWEADPSSAPGRTTSSPWPDHIDIGTATKNFDGSYTVTGDVAEVTSTGPADTYPVTITLEDVNGSWLITSYDASAPGMATTTESKG